MTDRLRDALTRAAEMVEELRLAGVPHGEAADFLAGWAEAAKLLEGTGCAEGWLDPAGRCATRTDDPDGWCPDCQAIAKFCTAMIGKEADDDQSL